MNKPSLPRGTRDFGPEQMKKRTFIIEAIKKHFIQYGFEPLETPSIENLSVLTGKYGEEGDKLIFKILNSGDFLQDGKVVADNASRDYISWIPQIAEKALRYDLTVPFARYLVMNQHTITFPFKRYQIQPVWRADRPQKGRYREFYQCDADIAGTTSLVAEAELVSMLSDVYGTLGIDVTLKVNNRKVLSSLAVAAGAPGQEIELCIAIDKWDKIGAQGVLAELTQRGFDSRQVQVLFELFNLKGSAQEKIYAAKQFLSAHKVAMDGIFELEELLYLCAQYKKDLVQVDIDFTLARGLNYYTGAIFEVKSNAVQIGSISGGGRYDNLTGLFGLQGVSGVGVSFGIDRIYDVLEETNGFPSMTAQQTQVLFANFGSPWLEHSLSLLHQLRKVDIKSEIYPSADKMKKQFTYADAKKIPYVALLGENEWENKTINIKNMLTGTQEAVSLLRLTTYFQS